MKFIALLFQFYESIASYVLRNISFVEKVRRFFVSGTDCAMLLDMDIVINIVVKNPVNLKSDHYQAVRERK